MIKLDTRNVKPKIYNIAVLTVILAAVVAILSIAGGEKKYLYILSVFTAYYLMVVVLLVRAFFRQIEYNLYSYNTIFYSGFALFRFRVFFRLAFFFFGFGFYQYLGRFGQNLYVFYFSLCPGVCRRAVYLQCLFDQA